MKLIDGKKIARQIREKAKKEVRKLASPPSLQVIAIGASELTQVFLREKEKACQETGINFRCHNLPVSAKLEKVTNLIRTLNSDPKVNGILVQLPLPPQLGLGATLLDQIHPKKDVDCLSSVNLGHFAMGSPLFLPPTAQAVNEILREEKIQIKGKNITIVGAGRVAGLPIAIFLLQQGATITVCHEFTKDLKEHTKMADVLISAAGQPKLIKGPMLKKGAIVVDVGTSWSENKIAGDVDLETVRKVASKATPIPGGVGPITVACLLKNVFQACQLVAQLNPDIPSQKARVRSPALEMMLHKQARILNDMAKNGRLETRKT